MRKKRGTLVIRFTSDAAGGPELVASALRAIEFGQPFLLPPRWRVVQVSAGLRDIKQKTLRLELIDSGDGDEAAGGPAPNPSHLSAIEPLR